MPIVQPFRPLKRMLRRVIYARAWAQLQNDRLAEASLQHLRASVDGKSVALVGNARALLNSHAGCAIDAHDVIMRFNFGFVTQPEHQGRRTDLVGVSSSVRPDAILAGHPGVPVAWLSERRHHMRSAFLRRIDELTIVPVQIVADLHRQLGSRPSSGIIALSVMRSLAPRSITLYGFDWKRSPSFYTHLMGPHDWGAETALVQRWQAEDARLTITDPSVPFSPEAVR